MTNKFIDCLGNLTVIFFGNLLHLLANTISSSLAANDPF